MNEKRKNLIRAWFIGGTAIILAAIFGRFGWPMALLIFLLAPYSSRFTRILIADQDRTWKEYRKQHNKILIVLIIYSVIAYALLIYRLLTESMPRLSAGLEAMIFISVVPWGILATGHQIYLFKQIGEENNTRLDPTAE